jgi:hypothetical protein
MCLVWTGVLKTEATPIEILKFFRYGETLPGPANNDDDHQETCAYVSLVASFACRAKIMHNMLAAPRYAHQIFETELGSELATGLGVGGTRLVLATRLAPSQLPSAFVWLRRAACPTTS